MGVDELMLTGDVITFAPSAAIGEMATIKIRNESMHICEPNKGPGFGLRPLGVRKWEIEM